MGPVWPKPPRLTLGVPAAASQALLSFPNVAQARSCCSAGPMCSGGFGNIQDIRLGLAEAVLVPTQLRGCRPPAPQLSRGAGTARPSWFPTFPGVHSFPAAAAVVVLLLQGLMPGSGLRAQAYPAWLTQLGRARLVPPLLPRQCHARPDLLEPS